MPTTTTCASRFLNFSMTVWCVSITAPGSISSVVDLVEDLSLEDRLRPRGEKGARALVADPLDQLANAASDRLGVVGAVGVAAGGVIVVVLDEDLGRAL